MKLRAFVPLLSAALFAALLPGFHPARRTPPASSQVSTAHLSESAVLTDPPYIPPLSGNYWLRIRKSERLLYLYRGPAIAERFPIALGYMPEGPKDHRDDYKTPEGRYYLCGRNPHSHYYRSLRISYPNTEDGERCLREGLISARQAAAIRRATRQRAVPPQNTAAGGDILIHGGGAGRDWTWGCIALDNENMKRLYGLMPLSAPVLIEK